MPKTLIRTLQDKAPACQFSTNAQIFLGCLDGPPAFPGLLVFDAPLLSQVRPRIGVVGLTTRRSGKLLHSTAYLAQSCSFNDLHYAGD